MPVTIFDLAKHRLGFTPENGQHFLDAGLPFMGGCESCEASVAAGGMYPSRSGFCRCKDCIGDDGWNTVEEANKDIFGLREDDTQ